MFGYWKITEDSDRYMNVTPLRRLPKAPNTYTHWTERASCNGVDPSMFEVVSYQGASKGSLKFEAAKKICDSCPVWHMCYQAASPNDFYYTMRAGIVPAQHENIIKWGKGGYRSGQKAGDALTCKRGHRNWKPRSRGTGRYCATCLAMTQEGRREFDARMGL